MVTTTVKGVSNAVTTIVDNCVSVTGGSRADAGSVMVVAAATPVEPPSTGTTEYVAFLRTNGRLVRGFGMKGRASVKAVTARSPRRLEDASLMVCCKDGATCLAREITWRVYQQVPQVPRASN
jgi:hypothetical protein